MNANDELRNAVAEYLQQQRPAGPQQPDAPGCAGLSDKARDVASTLYGEAILQKPAGQISAGERDFLRAGIAAWKGDQ